MAEAIPISILAKISEYLVAPIGRQLSYLFQLSGNVETLKNELENLGKLRADVQQEIKVAENNVETILKTVETWLDRVSSVEGEAQSIVVDSDRFPEGCFNNWCLNLKPRYVLSRRAKKRTRDIVRLRQEKNFEKVALPAPPELFIGSTSTPFGSREVILNEIIKGLKDEDINMIGICGMGGVGKTTMVDEVLKRVKEENMFGDYAKSGVSQTVDTIKIQRDIAEWLSLRLDENNPDVRASRLNQRLEGKKVLIILDDVWEEFDLKKNLGITLEGGQRRCKIVFTSRTQGLWMKFQSRRELSLDPLPFNESWNLFKENIGVFLDDKPEFVPIAEQIVKECDGLPLALVTLGHALLGKSKHAWNDTLLKLGKISGVQQKVYESIRQSYDYLGDEEAKSLFLLCSLFEEDSHIYVESLVNIGMGLRLFKGINSVEAARDRVFTLVEHLQSRCLVSKWETTLTVHDVVRDVSKSIASTENGSLVLEQGVTLEMLLDQTSLEHCTRISIISNKIKEFPSQLQFPTLELLRSKNKDLDFPDSCFEGMVKLQVLDIICSTVLKLPSSLQSLPNLHTLCLRNCRLEDFTAIKYLQNLEILRITDEHIKELPKEIGQLTKLRLLDMTDCKSLRRISPGIISGLTVLEELYLRRLDIDWGEEENEQGRIAAHREFKSLSNLYILHIVIKDPSFLPLFMNLKKYHIQIGDVEYNFIQYSQNYERILLISGVTLEKNFKFLLHHSEALLLRGESTKSLVCVLLQEASQSIKCLVISKTETPEYLANAMDRTKAPFLPSTLESLTLESLDNLHQIINGPLVLGDFAKLKRLVVSECKQLRNIFRLSNAVDVLHLEELRVNKCESMEEVICWEGREEDANRKLQFPNLKFLEINGKSFICFCKRTNEIELHQLEVMMLSSIPVVECIVSISDDNRLNSIFPPKVLFPKLVMMNLYNLKNMKETWGGQLQSGSFCNLAELNIEECDSLEYVFSPFTATYLMNLHTLSLSNCPSLKEIVDGPLETGSLGKLKNLNVRKCNQLRNIFRLPTKINIVHLEILKLHDCKSMEEVIKWEGGEEYATSKLQFPKLIVLEIQGSADICFCRGAKEIEFHQLYRLHLNDLCGVECLNSISIENPLKSMFPRKVLFPRLNRVELMSMPDAKEICRGQPQVGFLCNLAKLDIRKCDSLEYVFSPCMVRYLEHLYKLDIYDCPSLKKIVDGPLEAGSLVKLKDLTVDNCSQLKNIFQLPTEIDTVHLESLLIRDCEKMEEVIKWEGREEDATSKLQFPKLRHLNITGSADICFCKGAKEIEFHQLCSLTLSNLPEVECLISISNENLLKSMFPHKVLFPTLEKMELNSMPNVKETWCGQPQAESFCNLAELMIKGCDSLEYVFSPCMAGYLVHLYKLDIYDCPSLKKIVDGPLEAGSLVKLENLNVRNCNQLRNIFRLPTEIDIVHLERLVIVGCESMEEVIKWEGREEDAPSKLHFPKLRQLFIQESADICFCRGANEIEFHQLYSLTLINLPGVECLISISNENPLKFMFPHKVLFPRLEEMELKFMPNVKEIWCGQPQVGSFCNLATLIIEGCHSLEYVFSPCMARYLVHLRKLWIYDSWCLKEVVAAENDKYVEEEYPSSILPKLQSVILIGLLSLGRFCHFMKDLVFPMLDNVRVVDCPEFNTFATGFVRTPNLNHVQIDEEERFLGLYLLPDYEGETLWKENLNNTIQRLYEDQLQEEEEDSEEEEYNEEGGEEDSEEEEEKDYEAASILCTNMKNIFSTTHLPLPSPVNYRDYKN